MIYLAFSLLLDTSDAKTRVFLDSITVVTSNYRQTMTNISMPDSAGESVGHYTCECRAQAVAHLLARTHKKIKIDDGSGMPCVLLHHLDSTLRREQHTYNPKIVRSLACAAFKTLVGWNQLCFTLFIPTRIFSQIYIYTPLNFFASSSTP